MKKSDKIDIMHRLLETCDLSNTLILDEDGLYDPSHFNDRLLLRLKGTMSEAEIHVLRARLQGGAKNKLAAVNRRCVWLIHRLSCPAAQLHYGGLGIWGNPGGGDGSGPASELGNDDAVHACGPVGSGACCEGNAVPPEKGPRELGVDNTECCPPCVDFGHEVRWTA